jgi:hypothetical protein
MLETIAIPILVKAIDFLFEEGKIILEERRERRKIEEKKQQTAIPVSQDLMASGSVDTGVIRSKDVALSTPVSEVAWKDSERKVNHLLSLLETYKKNYYLTREQYAKYGSADVRPITIHNLTEAEDGIATTMKELQTILIQIYGKEINAFQE